MYQYLNYNIIYIICVSIFSDTFQYDKMTHKGVSKWVKQGVPARE